MLSNRHGINPIFFISTNVKAYLLFFVVFSSRGYAQFEKSESAPPSIKWYEKNSKNFKVYYPLGLDSIANHTIHYLEKNIKEIQVDHNDKIRKSHILLHNQNTISNAFVVASLSNAIYNLS